MSQQTLTVLLRGGLNLVSPPLAVPAGQCTAALNYEPEVQGYRRIGGYERFDGRTRPSSGATPEQIATLRAAISAVPGSGPVRGVWPYAGSLWAFRDTLGGLGAMYKSTAAGWVQQTFGHTIDFNTGTAAFLEGETLVGGTSGATAKIQRISIVSGATSTSNQAGYMVLSAVVGTFVATEIIASASGSATVAALALQAVALEAGGIYEFTNHNFYGSTKPQRMYFANGTGTAFEWDGSVLSPIRSGSDAGVLANLFHVLERGGGRLKTRNGDFIALRGNFDRPNYIAQFRNHLFLGFGAGSVVSSGIGEPLDYRAIAGATEFSFGQEITGFIPSMSTAFIIFGKSRIEYIAGNDSSDFQMLPITSTAGAFTRTASSAGESPVYLDDAGVRKLSSTASFGDFRMGSMSQMVEPLFKAKRKAGVSPITSIVVKAKDQYRLFFDDRTGIIVYMGRKTPEVLPFLYPMDVFCASSGELDITVGERHFVGAEDGFVYELDAGTSFDGAAVQAYMRLAWNTANAPTQNKRYHSATVDIDSEDAIPVGIAFHVDYAIPGNTGGARTEYNVAAGSQSLIPIALYDSINWTQPMQGVLEADLDGVGRNMALTLITEHTNEDPHTLSTMTVNYSWRGLKK